MKSLSRLALLPLLLLTSPALAQDADADGVPDVSDGAPCDPGATAVAFAPAEGVRAMLAYEDLWPSAGDLDFNDLVLGVNYTFRMQGSQVRSLRANIAVRAVGSLYDNGFALHLPGVLRGDVASIVRTVGGQSPVDLVPNVDPELTVVVSSNAREFFGDRAGPINSTGDAFPAPTVEVEIRFTQPVTLDLTAAPFDLFLFRTHDRSHEIHPTGYAGSAAMNGALFGTADDGSAGGRFFVDSSGMPFVLTLPDDTLYPQEEVSISALYPAILGFAASGGLQNRDFYVSSVNSAAAYTNGPPSGPVVSGIDRACLVGQTAVAAGRTCQDIRDTIGNNAANGVYWIDPDGPGWGADPFQVYCDMQTDGRGWEVLHHDEMRFARQPRGTPSAVPGWSVDYLSSTSPLRNARVQSFRFEVEGGPARSFTDIRATRGQARLRVERLLGTGYTGSWQCNSDTRNGDCDFTDSTGRSWGIWSHSSACCLGTSLGGFWYYSQSAQGTENYGMCGVGYPNGAAYSGSTSGCSGDGFHTPVSPAGSGVMRILVQLWAPVAEGRTCRTILEDGDSRGDGVYVIDPDGPHGRDPIEVYCDMTTDGGGWIVVHDDVYSTARTAHGRPSASPGWGVDYLSAESGLSRMEIEDFRFEIPGVQTRIFPGVRAYTGGRPLTPPELFDGNHSQSWSCDTDNPTASNCYFTTNDGRNWGLWEHTRSCCIGSTQGGFWFYSRSTQGTENWGLCDSGYPLGANYTGSYSGCNGGGYYTPVNPVGSQRFRLAFREPARAPTLNTPAEALATCRALLDAGAARGDGMYYVNGRTGRPERVHCDMTTDGGGWTTFLSSRNGSPNVFDEFDANVHQGICFDEGRRCMRRVSSDLPQASTEFAVVHGSAVVAFDATPATYAYFTAGTQASWQPVQGRALTPTARGVNSIYTGQPSNEGWIAATNQNASLIFAANYNRNAGWNGIGGVADVSTPIRLMFREGGRPARPVLNTQSTARASCRVVLDNGESQGDGLYWLSQGGAPYQAWCDMTLDGGGWTTFVTGYNGQASTFDHMESGYHAGVCTDPATRCFRRMPTSVPVANTEMAVTSQDQAIAFPLTLAVQRWASQGVQANWQPIQAVALTGDVRTRPTGFWTGSGANTSWIAAQNNVQSGTFAAMYDFNNGWDYSNGRQDAWSPVRLMYREGGIPTDPNAYASCAAARDAGGTTNGVYRIQRPGHRPQDVYCNQTADGGGWNAIFSGLNGHPNVFDRFDAAYHRGVCTDASNRCLRYLPADVDTSRLEMAVSCGDAMVAFTPTTGMVNYFRSGTQASWQSFSGARSVGQTAVVHLPDSLWTGSGANRAFIFANARSTARVFGATYNENGSWSGCNSAPDTTSPLYVFWRE